MSTQNVSEEISQIDSFLRQLRGGVPPVLTKDADEFQKPPPVATTTPQGNNLAQSSADTLEQPHPLPPSAALQSGGHSLPPPTHPSDLTQYQTSKLVDYSSSDSSSDASSSGDSASTEDQLSGESDDSGACDERDHFGLVQGEGSRGRAKKLTGPKVKGELTADALPPLVERLSLELPEGCMLSMCGKVSSVVEDLIVIEGVKDSQPLDADTVLWNKDKTSIGKIFEIFGPVKLPYYSVRKALDTELGDLGISVGDPVFYVPSSNAMTKYVFTDGMQKQKGSDASWEHDIEPPEEHLDYSDDEEERAARRRLQDKRRTEAEGEGQGETSTVTEERTEKKKSHKHKHKRRQHRQHHHELHRHDYHQYGGQAPPPAFNQLPYQPRQHSSAIYSQDPSMQVL